MAIAILYLITGQIGKMQLQAQNDGGYLFIPNSYAENQYVHNIFIT